MITYELCFLTRIMPRSQLVSTLKRVTGQIFAQKGIIRKIDNLGEREIPYRTSSHGMVHKKAHYFVIDFHAPPSCLQDLQEEYNRDIDLVRQRIFKKNEETISDCTLHEEMQPPPYRKDVQELVAAARKLDKPKYKYNTGLEYYPFQK